MWRTETLSLARKNIDDILEGLSDQGEITMYQQKIIVVMPAHNEAASISHVIKKIPRHFDSRLKIEVLVIDDGSTDKTAKVAKQAGADHIFTFKKNQGLGAAVRKGFEESMRLGADIVVILEADNEYPADQMPELLKPIFFCEADYVIGSRFLGHIEGMNWTRRLSNYFFNCIQFVLLRRWIHDGQSGMRALTRQAIQNAEIVHDYNYAQVLTLNIVRKGFRVAEVPIRYEVRSTGNSFVTLKEYMSKVLSGVWKEMTRSVQKVPVRTESHRLHRKEGQELLLTRPS